MRIALPRVSKAGMFAIGVMAAYLFGKMFYVAGQGGAQPADIAVAACFLLLITPRALVRLSGVNLFVMLLMIWAVIVNLGWLLTTNNPEFLRSISYYAFNLGIVAAVFWTRQKNPRLFDIAVPAVCAVAMVVQLFVVTFGGGEFRSVGTFENPNQLAFWGVCMLGIWILCRPGRIGPLDLGMAGSVMWIELASLSRAGLAAAGLLTMIWLFRTVRTTRARLIALMVVIMAALAMALTPAVSGRIAESQSIAALEKRLNRNRPVSEFETRGYDRILRYVSHIVIGAGEGEKERFVAPGSKHTIEIHSTFGTLLFSYGLLGISMFFLFLWRTTRVMGFDRYIYLAPSMAYGMTHNGLRFSFFWFMVGMLLSYAITEGKKARSQRPAQRPVFDQPMSMGGRPGPAVGR